MDSINRNQPEHNRENLTGEAAIAKIKELAEKAQSCFFRTSIATGDSTGVRPMNVRQVDDEGNLWFLSAADSHKNAELAVDPSVELYFQGSPHSDFLHLTGRVELATNRAKLEELWSATIKTWFTDGLDDPRITILKFIPTQGYYWDTKHASAIAGIKILIGAAIGKTLDDSIEGTMKL